MRQTTDTVVMVSPDQFSSNPETANSNAFQRSLPGSNLQLRAKAQIEFWRSVEKLDAAGVGVLVLQSPPNTPDAVFPNNWFWTDDQGQLYTFPLASENRRAEIQVETLVQKLATAGYPITNHRHIASQGGGSLEGTGSLVFDHQNKIAYAALSNRTSLGLAISFTELLGYMLVPFKTVHHTGKPIYHTNVMMSIGEHFVACCFEAISEGYRLEVTKKLRGSDRNVIGISPEQLDHFCGNILELRTTAGQPVVAMSEQAAASFTSHQLKRLEKMAAVLALPIATIEAIGGGSARCMLAEVFISRSF